MAKKGWQENEGSKMQYPLADRHLLCPQHSPVLGLCTYWVFPVELHSHSAAIQLGCNLHSKAHCGNNSLNLDNEGKTEKIKGSEPLAWLLRSGGL